MGKVGQRTENGSLTIQASVATSRPQPSGIFTIPDPIVVSDWSSEILRSAPSNGLAPTWPRSSFSADSPEEAVKSKAASRSFCKQANATVFGCGAYGWGAD